MRSHDVFRVASWASALAILVFAAGACSKRAKPVERAQSGAPTPGSTSSADEVVAAQLPTYPLSVCPVSGKKLGSMGAPYDHVYEGRLVRFCCDGCLKEFAEDPAFYVAKIDSAAAKSTAGG